MTALISFHLYVKLENSLANESLFFNSQWLGQETKKID